MVLEVHHLNNDPLRSYFLHIGWSACWGLSANHSPHTLNLKSLHIDYTATMHWDVIKCPIAVVVPNDWQTTHWGTILWVACL